MAAVHPVSEGLSVLEKIRIFRYRDLMGYICLVAVFYLNPNFIRYINYQRSLKINIDRLHSTADCQKGYFAILWQHQSVLTPACPFCHQCLHTGFISIDFPYLDGLISAPPVSNIPEQRNNNFFKEVSLFV